MIVKNNENLSKITSIGIGGKCKAIYYPENQNELINLIKEINNKEKYKVIGNATNLLFSDEFHDIIVISTRKMQRKMSKRLNYVTFSSSTTLFEAYQYCLKHQLSGFERLATIPGNIGGAIASGASCFENSIFDNLTKVQVLYDNNIFWINKERINPLYHNSIFMKNDLTKPIIILNAKFCLKEKNKCEIQEDYLKCCIKRKQNQPFGKSFGCIFKNKNGQSTGLLIEKCNLKGLQKGDAIISEKHGNFIINQNNATYKDVKLLIEIIEEKIRQEYNIFLEKDVEIIE